MLALSLMWLWSWSWPKEAEDVNKDEGEGGDSCFAGRSRWNISMSRKAQIKPWMSVDALKVLAARRFCIIGCQAIVPRVDCIRAASAVEDVDVLLLLLRRRSW